MSAPIHIAFGFDARMELPSLLTADSIRRRLAPGRSAVIHVLHTAPLRFYADYLARTSVDACSFAFHAVETPLAAIRMHNGLPPAAYLRFLLPELLADVDRVVWVDCDAIALKDIVELHDTDLGGCAVAAVPSFAMVGPSVLRQRLLGEEGRQRPAVEYLKEVLALDDPDDYFNSGVMVMDLAQFRARGLIEKSRDFAIRTADVRVFNDQDALNHVIGGAYRRLDPRWNLLAWRRPEDVGDMQADVAARYDADPWILHFAGAGKPWIGNLLGTLKDHLYWREALRCPMLPELLDHFLATAADAGLTHLFSPRELLALGKPRLDEAKLRAAAQGFQDRPEVAAALCARLDQLDAWPGPRAFDIAPSQFMHRGGTPADGALAFALAGIEGHLVYGPYARLAAGDYMVVYDLALEGADPAADARIVIEVGSSREPFKAQRIFSAVRAFAPRALTLSFRLQPDDMSVEFRVFAAGYRSGTLRFAGVRLMRQTKAPSVWRRMLQRFSRGGA